MRDPNNIIEVMYNNEAITVLPIANIPEYDIEDYDLLDDKDFAKYIKQIEITVRTSFEYRQMISFLRENMDMNKCSFYENVNNIDTYKIKIEIHHEPITLYDIAIIVYNKRNMLRESLSEELVAKEIMFLHYNLLIGLIPLAETVHELVHNQYLFVPTDKVLGRYKEFVNMYYEFIPAEQLDVLQRIEEATLRCNDVNMNLLSKNYIHLDFTGAYKLPKYEDIIKMMSNRIDDIKTKKTLIHPLIKHNE